VLDDRLPPRGCLADGKFVGERPLIIYLHGFASSPQSGKATYLSERLRARGIDIRIPDLNVPDFSTLTVTRMLEQTRALLDQSVGPVTLFGSSLGGYVAVNAAARWSDRVERLVLLAPALDFSEQGLSAPGGGSLADWKRAGRLMVFHFGYGRMMPIEYGLYEDARRYDAVTARVEMPILIFQGRRDTVVSPATVERWAASRPNVELHMLDDDHQLAASLAQVWARNESFLGLTP
jgi:pimeloyl-ACP methyl ester carboxylesterase